jgi:hypothetical protein
MPFSEKSANIELHVGTNPILLIAPHAHPDDGAGTGDIVREIARLIPCQTIINEEYRRPGICKVVIDEIKKEYVAILDQEVAFFDEDKIVQFKNEDGTLNPKKYARREATISHIKECSERPEKNKKVLDWYSTNIEKNLNQEFISPLHDFLALPGNKIILSIFAVADESLYKAGQGDLMFSKANEETNFIAKLEAMGKYKYRAIFSSENLNDDTSKLFIQLLSTNSNHPVATDITHSPATYFRNKESALGQWLKENNYNPPETQSLSLLLRRQGIRDNQENIQATARTIAKALIVKSGDTITS